MLMAGVDAVRRTALERTRTYVVQRGKDCSEEVCVPDPDCKAALSAYELTAKLLGLITTKVDATVRDYSNLSPEEFEAKRAELAAKLAAGD